MTIEFVQIETTTTCNQRCTFCPVSRQKRPKSILSDRRFQKIVDGLDPAAAVVISGFTEPTYDKQLVERVRTLVEAGHSVSICSNGSGLDPALTDQLLEAGIGGFTINLSTVDADQYLATRGSRELKQVIRNVSYLFEKTEESTIDTTLLMLGSLDSAHIRNIGEIRETFSGFSRINFLISPLADFAGRETGQLPNRPRYQTVRGCALGRHTRWAHFTASGNAILCCQDYLEDYRLGNIDADSVAGIFDGDTARQMRRWVEGEDAAPADFICRHCIFALTDQDFQQSLRGFFCDHCELQEGLPAGLSCDSCEVGALLRSGIR